MSIPRPERASSRARLVLAGLAALVLAAGCDRGPADATPGSSVEREDFIATYVDLRAAAIRARPDHLDPAVRDSILSAHGVTQDGLLDFVRDHGENVSYMRDVWDEVEQRLDAVRLSDDGTDARR